MAASARATQSSKPPRTGSWQQDGDSSVLQFTALPMRMHTLALVITLMVLPIGAATAAMLIGSSIWLANRAAALPTTPGKVASSRSGTR